MSLYRLMRAGTSLDVLCVNFVFIFKCEALDLFLCI